MIVQAVDGGKLLYVDLGSRRVEARALDEAYRRAYLGGVGLATRLLWDECPPRIDAFDPRNPLVFATGAFTGTSVP